MVLTMNCLDERYILACDAINADRSVRAGQPLALAAMSRLSQRHNRALARRRHDGPVDHSLHAA